jgi:hypothetical protein
MNRLMVGLSLAALAVIVISLMAIAILLALGVIPV